MASSVLTKPEQVKDLVFRAYTTLATAQAYVQSIHYSRSYLTGGCSNHLQPASSPQLDIVNLHRQSTAKEQCSILVKQQACLDGDSRIQRNLPLGDLNEE